MISHISCCYATLGGFANVKLGYHLATGDSVAIKVMRKKDLTSDSIDDVRLEVEAMKNLNHPNICKIYQFIETEDTFFLILEV